MSKSVRKRKWKRGEPGNATSQRVIAFSGLNPDNLHQILMRTIANTEDQMQEWTWWFQGPRQIPTWVPQSLNSIFENWPRKVQPGLPEITIIHCSFVLPNTFWEKYNCCPDRSVAKCFLVEQVFFLVHVGRGGRGGWWVHKAQDSGYGQGFGQM